MSDKKTVTWQKIFFELRMIASNPYINIFGVGFPIFLACMISKAAVGEIPDARMVKEATTQIFLGMGTIIIMATVLMGYAVSRSMEIEKGISERMSLFGIAPMEIVLNRICAQLIFIAGSFLLFFTVGGLCGYIMAPRLSGVILYVVCMVVFTIILFSLGHGVASLCRKYGLTYMVSMTLYFAIMVLSGMMGMSYDQFPKALKAVAKLLPTTYINDSDYVKAWLGNSYNLWPIVQAFLFMAAASGIVLFVAVKRRDSRY